ncbi:MAG: hypothetical protein U1A78_16465 [Polyangia bacterium]
MATEPQGTEPAAPADGPDPTSAEPTAAPAPAAAPQAAPEAAPGAAPAPAGPPPPHVIYRWDLDKTYLQTEFDTVRQLLRTAFEGPEDKRTVPGAATLLRELKRGAPPSGGPSEPGRPSGGARICFISGSPRQMRRVLTEKLRLDGVEYDEFILKPNLRNMLTGRFRAMREQVGYKLPALLTGRAGVQAETHEVCFGDDAESDGFIYSLYGDVLAGRVAKDLLERILTDAGVYPGDAARAVSLAAALPRADAVERIFIHLDRRSPPSRFDRYGLRLVPVYNYFQVALVLYQDRRLTAAAVVRVAVEMVDKHGYSIEVLRNSLHDLLRRWRLRSDAVQALGAAIAEGAGEQDLLPALGALPGTRDLLRSLARGLRDLGPLEAPPPPPSLDEAPIDYLQALEVDLPRKRKR